MLHRKIVNFYMQKTKNCPLCKAKQKNIVRVANNVYGDKSKKRAFYLCDKCDVRYLYPRLTQKEEKKFYKQEFEKFMSKRSGVASGWLNVHKHIKQNKETFVRRFKFIKPFLKLNSKILEVGCSSGFMLFPLIKKKHNCVGVEPSGVFSKFLKNQKLEIYKQLSDLKKKCKIKKFDLIMHFFVLEHISDPLKFLDELSELLNEGGKIIFEIPNVADPLHTIYKSEAFENFYWSVAHHWYFSSKSLAFVLKQLKQPYKIKLDQRYDLSNHLVWSKDGKPGGVGKYSKYFGKKLDNDYKNFLIKSGYCDTLIGIVG